MSINSIDVTPIETAVQLQQQAEAALRTHSDKIAASIAAKARETGVLTDHAGVIDLPGGYQVEVLYTDARLRWPRPFLPSGEKLLRDIRAGWLEQVADHLSSSPGTAKKRK
jgi:hypothetical protein